MPYSSLTPSGAITTTHDGQVIERLDIRTRIKVLHSNVVIRDVRILADATTDGTYPIHITRPCRTCAYPTNVLIEYVEIDGQPGISLGSPAVYGPRGNWTLRYADIHGVGSGPRLTTNTRVEHSYMHDTPTTDPSEHKSGIGLNGGSHNAVIGNNIECSAPGCSAALALYGSNAPVDDVLVQGNLFNTTGSYCVYGGSLSSKDFPEGTNIRILENVFGVKHHPKCGRSGPVSSWDPTLPGNEGEGNMWQGSGDPVTLAEH